jgi:hypothetical protein
VQLAQPGLTGSLFTAARATCAFLHDNHTITAFRYLIPPETEIPDRFFDGLAVARGRLVQDEATLGPVIPREFVETARGVFSLVSIERQRVCIFCDPLSVYPLWYWHNDDLFVCSNNTHLIRSFLAKMGIQLKKDARFFAWQLIFQNGVGDSTGYEEVRWTPFGRYVTVSAEEGTVAVAMQRLRASSDERLYRSELSTDALVEQARAEIAENVTTIASGDFRVRTCDLSGGLDTRVMVAAVLGKGLGSRFGFNTAGTESTPDGNVAALIRERYDLCRSRYAPNPERPAPAFPIELRSMLFRTYGCFSQHASVGLGLRSDRSMLHFNGGCGETFRGPYSAGLEGNTTALERLINHVRVHGALIRPEVREEFIETLVDLFAAKARAGFGDADAGDHHYIEHRNRQFMGIQSRSRLNFQSLAYPLYSPAAIAAAFSASQRLRGAACVHFALVDSLFPELLEAPLEGRAWDAALYDGHPREQELSSIKPVAPNDASLTSARYVDRSSSAERATYAVYPVEEPTDWQRKMTSEGRHWSWVHLESSLHWLRQLLEDSRSSDSMEAVFDPNAVREFSDRDLSSFTNSTEIRHVYRLLSTLLWLDDQELGIPLQACEVRAG